MKDKNDQNQQPPASQPLPNDQAANHRAPLEANHQRSEQFSGGEKVAGTNHEIRARDTVKPPPTEE